jgi:N-methylhydantoinase A
LAYNVAVDVGGTFTDVIVFDEQAGELTEGKVLSTPDDPSRGVVTGVENVCEKMGISFTELNLFFHGTTVVTNMILTNTGARGTSCARCIRTCPSPSPRISARSTVSTSGR